ncbi:MAG TPA: hypothetical protein VHQ65_10785 [Thermoanaerobaculia bacterium]|nr:hypothetical protein [Thermoanaerobaculia bacterium]
MQSPAIHSAPRPRRRPRSFAATAPSGAAARPAAERSALLGQVLTASALVLLAVLLLALAAMPAAGQEATAAAAEPREAALTGRYQGVLVNLGNLLPRALASRITLEVERLTPPAELRRLGALLEERGQNALRNELADRDVGHVQVDQEIGYPIAAAFATDGADGMRHLVLVMARPISIGEVLRGSRLADYPFSIIVLDLEQEGYGTGELAVAASIAQLREDRLRVDEYPVYPLRIVRVEHQAGR